MATSLGAAAALALVSLTGIQSLDAIVACGIAVLVARTGLQLVVAGTRVLVDEAIPENEVAILHDVLDGTDGIRGWHRLRARRAGAIRHIDLHLLVDPSMSVARAHAITDDIEAELERRAWRRRRRRDPHRARHARSRAGRGAPVNPPGRGCADAWAVPPARCKEPSCAASFRSSRRSPSSR